MKPRSSSTFVPSRPMFSVFGLRPTATSSVSASISSFLPLASVAVSFGRRSRSLWMFSALAPVSQRMPVFLNTRSSSLETSSSSTGTRRGSISSTRDLGPEAVENGRELDADGARADDRQGLGDGGQLEDLDVGEDVRRPASSRAACALPSRWRSGYSWSPASAAPVSDFTSTRPLPVISGAEPRKTVHSCSSSSGTRRLWRAWRRSYPCGRGPWDNRAGDSRTGCPAPGNV